LNIRSLFQSSHVRLEEDLDAYVDGQLEVHARERLETHLAGCDTCRRQLDDGIRLKSLMGSLPQLAAPRSFAITEAMLRPAPVTAPARSGAWTGAMRSMQGMAAAGLALFAVLVVADLSGGTTATSPDGNDAELASITAAEDDGGRNAADADGDAVNDASGTGDEDVDDSSSTVPIAESTPTSGGVGAQGNEPPPGTPGAEYDDHDVAGESTSSALPETSGATGNGGETGATELQLRETGDDGGFDRLLVAQILAAGIGLVAAVGYMVVRRAAPGRR
jgi:anti-sigma factor RsiW